MAEPVTILILCGSLRADSVTHRALEEVAEGAREAGGTVVWADEWVARLPLFAETADGDPAVVALRRAAGEADGFIWGSPEYHAAPSGILKNALDFLSFDQTEGKWVGLVVSAGGDGAGANTLASLRTIARAVHLWCPPHQVAVPGSRSALGDDGTFRDPEVGERLKILGRIVVGAVHRSKSCADGS